MCSLTMFLGRLTDEKRMDMQFVKTFITTYESFVSSERLLEKLVCCVYVDCKNRWKESNAGCIIKSRRVVEVAAS